MLSSIWWAARLRPRSFAVLKPGGALISALSPPDQAATTYGVRAAFFLVDITTACLTQIAALVETGARVTAVRKVVPPASAREAHQTLKGSGRLP
jgi:hypothetical protein